MSEKKDYEKIGPTDVMFSLVESLRNASRWVCDSKDHNEPEGCSNPDCFKNKEKQSEGSN